MSKEGIFLGVGFGISTLLNGCAEQNPPTPPVTPSATATPDRKLLENAPHPNISLQATVVAMKENNLQSSFKEEDGFNTEFFERVRRSTFLIRMKAEDGYESWGTGWLAKKENNTHYIITAGHLMHSASVHGIRNTEIWRPGIDSNKIISQPYPSYSYYPNLDIAVIKFDNNNFPQNIDPLNWQDGVLASAEDRFLMVGFPGEFKKAKELDSYTMGSVIKAIGRYSSMDNVWYARGIVNGGVSGAPVVINRNGEALVLGTVVFLSNRLVEVSEHEIQNQYVVGVSKLAINGLINVLTSK